MEWHDSHKSENGEILLNHVFGRPLLAKLVRAGILVVVAGSIPAMPRVTLQFYNFEIGLWKASASVTPSYQATSKDAPLMAWVSFYNEMADRFVNFSSLTTLVKCGLAVFTGLHGSSFVEFLGTQVSSWCFLERKAS